MARKATIIALWILAPIGALVLLALAALWLWTLGLGARAHDSATAVKDVTFILNWAEFSPERIEAVANSYQSRRSMSGEHLDAYSIKVTHLDASELTHSSSQAAQWIRGDQLPQGVVDAIEFAVSSGEIGWFPPASELRSKDTWVLPWQITLHSLRPQQVQLIFAQPSKKLILYLDMKV